MEGRPLVGTVMVDAARYSVEKTFDTIIVDGRICNADVDYNRARIRLSGKADVLGEGREAQVLMHEIVHAMLHERARTEEAEDEELVDALAAGFVNLVRQNLELVEFIRQS